MSKCGWSGQPIFGSRARGDLVSALRQVFAIRASGMFDLIPEAFLTDLSMSLAGRIKVRNVAQKPLSGHLWDRNSFIFNALEMSALKIDWFVVTFKHSLISW